VLVFVLISMEKRDVDVENALVEVLVTEDTWFSSIKRVSFHINVDGETRGRLRKCVI
jgi:hypothetical protein